MNVLKLSPSLSGHVGRPLVSATVRASGGKLSPSMSGHVRRPRVKATVGAIFGIRTARHVACSAFSCVSVRVSECRHEAGLAFLRVSMLTSDPVERHFNPSHDRPVDEHDRKASESDGALIRALLSKSMRMATDLCCRCCGAVRSPVCLGSSTREG